MPYLDCAVRNDRPRVTKSRENSGDFSLRDRAERYHNGRVDGSVHIG